MGGRRPSEGSPSPACIALLSARVHLRREGGLLCAPAVCADPHEPCSSVVPSARCCRGLAGASCLPCVTAHAFRSWRAVSEGSPGQGWQSAFMISRLFKRPHKRAPSILKGKWLFAGRAVIKQESDPQTLPETQQPLGCCCFFRGSWISSRKDQ